MRLLHFERGNNRSQKCFPRVKMAESREVAPILQEWFYPEEIEFMHSISLARSFLKQEKEG